MNRENATLYGNPLTNMPRLERKNAASIERIRNDWSPIRNSADVYSRWIIRGRETTRP